MDVYSQGRLLSLHNIGAFEFCYIFRGVNDRKIRISTRHVFIQVVKHPASTKMGVYRSVPLGSVFSTYIAGFLG